MSNQNDEDEWDQVELKLESMKVNEVKQIAKPPVTIAPRFNHVSAADPKQTAIPASFSAPVVDSTVEHVDTALYNAMTNPRERMAVLQMENSILNFVKSSMERSMDMPPVNNSFRRLLAYRVGQRFNLQHMQSEYPNENGERGITLLRTSSTCLPRVLLIDLNIPVKQDDDSPALQSYGNYDDYTSTSTVAVPIPASTSSKNTSSSTSSSQQPVKKMLVMKRNPARDNQDNNKGVSAKSQQSAEDKEKAYLEARARIFGEDNSTASTPGAGTPTNELTGNSSPMNSETSGGVGINNKKGSKQSSPGTSNRNSNSSSPQPTVATNTTTAAVRSNTGTSGIAVIETSPTTVKRVSSDSQLNTQQSQQQQGQGGKKNIKSTMSSTTDKDITATGTGSTTKKPPVVDATSWKEKKSVTRDIEAEKYDPDFARRGGGGGRDMSGGMNYNIPSYIPQGGVGNMTQQQQLQHQQMQYQQHMQYQQQIQMQMDPAAFHMQQQDPAMYHMHQQAAMQYQQYNTSMEAAAMSNLSAGQGGLSGSRLGQYNTATTQLPQQPIYGGGYGNMPIAPTLSGGGNPYYPMSAAAGGAGVNPYYPGGNNDLQQQQQMFPPPPPPVLQTPTESFYDYSYLSTNNQQQAAVEASSAARKKNIANGSAGSGGQKTAQQSAAVAGLFNKNEFPPLA